MRRLMGNEEGDEMGKWKTLQEATRIGEDKRAIELRIPGAKEVVVIFCGRSNDVSDSLENSSDANSLKINSVNVGAVPLAYIRKSGVLFYTIIRIFSQNGYIDALIERKGSTDVRMCPNLATGETIEDIALYSNNLFKAESTVEVYYR